MFLSLDKSKDPFYQLIQQMDVLYLTFTVMILMTLMLNNLKLELSLLSIFSTISAPNPLTLHGAPIIEPSDPHIVIEVSTDKRIECKADKPVTWISEVRCRLTKLALMDFQKFPNSIRFSDFTRQ